MTTPLSLFLFMTGLIVISAFVLFGLSMLARRASALYAYIAGALALLPVTGCARSYRSEGTLFESLAWGWEFTLLALPLIVYVQARVLKLSLPAAIAGVLGDFGLTIFWFVPLAFIEMFLTADGGPGFGQYALVLIPAFLGVQLLAPIFIAKAFPKEKRLPPRVPVPGEYPRP